MCLASGGGREREKKIEAGLGIAAGGKLSNIIMILRLIFSLFDRQTVSTRLPWVILDWPGCWNFSPSERKLLPAWGKIFPKLAHSSWIVALDSVRFKSKLKRQSENGLLIARIGVYWFLFADISESSCLFSYTCANRTELLCKSPSYRGDYDDGGKWGDTEKSKQHLHQILSQRINFSL